MLKSIYGVITLLSCLILLTLPSTAGATGYDVVLLVDDSGSMKNSDPFGRRITVINQFRTLFNDAIDRGVQTQQPIDFRLSVIRFGDTADVFRRWITFNKDNLAPTQENLAIRYMGWTDFEVAIKEVRAQYSAIKYGKDDPNQMEEARKLVLIVVTDGVPSTSDDIYKGVPGKGKDPEAFWKKMDEALSEIRNNSPDFAQYMIVMHDPKSKEGADLHLVLPEWEKVGFNLKNNVFQFASLDDNNKRLFKQLEGVIAKNTGFPPYSGPDDDGFFHVPCFQKKLSLMLYFHSDSPNKMVKLRSPSNVLYPSGGTSPFWKDGGATLLTADIEDPEPGKWKIIDYYSDTTQYDLRFMPVSYQLHAIYPPKDNVLLQMPRELEFDIVLGNAGKRVKKGSCSLSGSIAFDEDSDGKVDGEPYKLEVKLRPGDQRIHAKSLNKYQLPSSKPALSSVAMKTILKAKIGKKESNIFETEWKTLNISDARPIAMQVHSSTAEITWNKATVHLKLSAEDYLKHTNVALSDVFVTPSQSVQAIVHCPNCIMKDSAPVTLKLSSNTMTLSADVSIEREGNMIEGYWRGLTRQDMNISITWQSIKGIKGKGTKLKDNVLLLQPDSGGAR